MFVCCHLWKCHKLSYIIICNTMNYLCALNNELYLCYLNLRVNSRGKQNAVLPQCPRTTPEHCTCTTPGSAGTLYPYYSRARE